MSHQEIEELLGAYALNALDATERAIVDEHLPTCASCRAEVDKFHETTSYLGADFETAPPELWGRIASQLQVNDASERPYPLADKSDSKRNRFIWIGAVAAALMLVFGAVGVYASLSSSKTDIAAIARDAANTPGARDVTLNSADGNLHATFVMSANGKAYLTDDNLPQLPSDRTYQLWTMVDSTPVSAGTLGSAPDVQAFTMSGNISALAISNEPAGGSVVPTTAPLVSGAV